MSEEKELVEEFDVYFSTASSAKYQILNNKDIDTKNGSIMDVQYKHKVPAMNFKLVHSGYEKYCKPEFSRTETNVNTEVQHLHTKTNFVCFISKGEAHCVPVVRPILRTFYDSTIPVEKTLSTFKKTPNQQQNHNIAKRKSLEEFNSDEVTFNRLPVMDEIRQPWIEAIYRDFDETCDKDRRTRLFCYQKDKTVECSIADEIKPLKISLMKKRPRLPSLSRESSHHSIEAEVLNILLKNQVIKFSKLMQLLIDCRMVSHDIISDKTVLHFLPTIALVIRGLWVLKSEVLFKICPAEKISSDKMRQARDYILCEFYEGRNVLSKKIQSVTSLPAVETEELLEQLAERNLDVYKKNGVTEWKFPEYDYQFINENSQINADQLLIMERKLSEVGRLFHDTGINNTYGAISNFIGPSINVGGNIKTILARKRQVSMSSHDTTYSGSHSQLKRRRSTTESNNYQNDIINYEPETAESHSIVKRKRHNSDQSASALLIKELDNVPSTSFATPNNAITDTIQDKLVPIDLPRIKTENSVFNTQFNFASVNTDADYEGEDDNIVYFNIKAEPKDANQNDPLDITESDELETSYPRDIFPNVHIYKDMKKYLKKESNELLLALYGISLRYCEEHLYNSANKSLLIIGWEDENNETIFLKITECFEYFLDNANKTQLGFESNKISITWPIELIEKTEEQPIYFCFLKNKESDCLFLEKILKILQIQDSLLYTDLKKAISGDKDMMHLNRLSKPELIEKMKKYCVMIKRRYYLKCIVNAD